MRPPSQSFVSQCRLARSQGADYKKPLNCLMITWLQVPRPMYTGVFGIDWITDTLKTIREEGASRYLGRISQPYVDAAARHLDPGSPAHTPSL